MFDFLAAITVALAMFGIMSMVLVPANPAHPRLRRIDQRPTMGQWIGKYFSTRTKRTTLPWWTTPFLGL